MGSTQSIHEFANPRNISKFDFENFEPETNHVTGHRNESEVISLQKKRKRNRRLDPDNIKSKILRNFLNFIVILINLIVKETLKDDYDWRTMEIFEFNDGFKKKSTKKHIELLKSNSIYIFLCEDKNINIRGDTNHNKNAFNLIIKKNGNLKNIFDKSCFDFFNIYYYKRNKFDISIFDINNIVDLSNLTCFYEDFIKNQYMDENYLSKFEKSINKNFLKNYFVVEKVK